MQLEYCQDYEKILLKKFFLEKVSDKKILKQNIRDKFKPYFCDQNFYIDHQSEFNVIDQQTKILSLKNKVIIFTIALSCLRRKKNWFGGLTQARNKKYLESTTPIENNLFCFYQLFEKLNIQWPHSLDRNIKFYDFLKLVRIKPIPETALNGLYFYAIDKYELKILEYEPTPIEILNLQIQNQRIVTFNPYFSDWHQIMDGERDPLSFILHDFIHAEHFFSTPQNRLGQIGFYKLIKRIFDQNLLTENLKNNFFQDEFNYLISDMNSHVLHLLKTFKALLDHNKIDSVSILNKISNLDQLTLNLFQNINHKDFSEENKIKLVTFFENY